MIDIRNQITNKIERFINLDNHILLRSQTALTKTKQMTIKIEEPTKEGYSPTLRFKALAKKDYLVISKEFDTPLEGPSQFCKETKGNWYKFQLVLHEYSQLDDNEDRIVVNDAQVVGYFDGDNEYEQKDGTYKQSQGTVLKALNASEVGEQLKITMFENKKGKMVYNVETVTGFQGVTEVSKPAAEATKETVVSEPLTMDAKISAMKNVAGMSLEDVTEKIVKEFGVSAQIVKNRWEVL